ncbi:hypothetical protein RhiirA5_430699 [Rhizophagus irregularis]|uniref:Uncharacterized protein n=1 Tax=Rhizophagus irregularis TaxID=588596 RepID=A0A2I1E9M3_9GLOM|nr:hypothetical protein RhiirA5_430699 [Rhizophagus irregularis]PKY18809.1 hypothetical protein RhiirB3_431695 [Rhizophagus irregularis]
MKRFQESLDDKNDENIEIIKKYIELGIIKNFEVRDFCSDSCSIVVLGTTTDNSSFAKDT